MFVDYRTKLFSDKVRASFQLNVKNLQEEGGRLQKTGAFFDGRASTYRIIDPRATVPVGLVRPLAFVLPRAQSLIAVTRRRGGDFFPMKPSHAPKHAASRRAETPSVSASAGWPLGAVAALIVSAALAASGPRSRVIFCGTMRGTSRIPPCNHGRASGASGSKVGATQQYYPLLHSAFWLEHRLWGDATVGYHLVNVLWHATSACLLVAILRRLAIPGALAGLIFALHPVGVESVAWISEQKNTLSTVCYLAAALAWLRFEGRTPARPLRRREPLVSGGAAHEDRHRHAPCGAARCHVVAAWAGIMARSRAAPVAVVGLRGDGRPGHGVV